MAKGSQTRYREVKIKQREANRIAMAMAAAMVRDADFYSLFGDLADAGETDAEYERNEVVMAKAQAQVAARLQRLSGEPA